MFRYHTTATPYLEEQLPHVVVAAVATRFIPSNLLIGPPLRR